MSVTTWQCKLCMLQTWQCTLCMLQTGQCTLCMLQTWQCTLCMLQTWQFTLLHIWQCTRCYRPSNVHHVCYRPHNTRHNWDAGDEDNEATSCTHDDSNQTWKRQEICFDRISNIARQFLWWFCGVLSCRWRLDVTCDCVGTGCRYIGVICCWHNTLICGYTGDCDCGGIWG